MDPFSAVVITGGIIALPIIVGPAVLATALAIVIAPVGLIIAPFFL